MRARQSEQADAKQALRQRAKRARAGIGVAERQLAAEQAAVRAAALVMEEAPQIVAGYYPIQDEIDCLALLASLSGQGTRLALPVTPTEPAPLTFLEWMPGDPLQEGRFGTMEPPASSPSLVPHLLLVPLLAFDKVGHRLGYGAGFYDRTLEALRGRGSVTAMGFAFAEQEVDAVPHDPRDQRLDWIITQSRAWRFGE